MRQRWNNLLFAHWPVAPEIIQQRLPPRLVVDTFDGHAWLGVVPFSMDQVQTRIAGEQTAQVPTTSSFHELNLRTYVRSRSTGLAGVWFFSLDCSSVLAVVGARSLFHLPYFVASIDVDRIGHAFGYRCKRRLTPTGAQVEVTYRSLRPPADASRPGTIEYFLTERYCLFTTSRGRLLVGDIHHTPWPLEPAEAEFCIDTLPAAHGFTLPDRAPLLHFSRELYVAIWPLRRER